MVQPEAFPSTIRHIFIILTVIQLIAGNLLGRNKTTDFEVEGMENTDRRNYSENKHYNLLLKGGKIILSFYNNVIVKGFSRMENKVKRKKFGR